MSLIDYVRGEFVRGKVLDKYRLSNGNIGLVVEQKGTYQRYHVVFRDGYKGPSLDNLYGLLKEPFGGKTEYLEQLINKVDTIDLTVSYSKSPLREAYRIHSVSGQKPYKNKVKMINSSYKLV
ncbi:hypothetical protein ACFL0M_00965 [Thermodesulfobacteriota bacterium]